MSLYFPFFVFFIPFSAYLFSILPSIYWRDAPEFQAIGFLIDIAHPAGSPLYSTLLKLFTFIPMGSIAFKTTLASCAFGAGVSVLVYYIIQVLLKSFSRMNESSVTLIQWIGLFTTLLYSFSNALWQNANLPEVYSLQNFFTALFILLLLKICQCKASPDSPKKILFLFLSLSFLFGLSLGAHAILILYLPFFFFLVYFLWLKRAKLNPVKIYAFILFFFLIGFSIYLYLPIRSAQNPYYDWGNPETFLNLIRHASDRKDAGSHFGIPQNVLPRQLLHYSKFYPDNFSFLGIILGLIGLTYLFLKKEKVILIIFGIIAIPPFLFFIRFWGEASAFLPAFLIFTFLIAVGIFFVLSTIKERIGDRQNAAVLLAMVSVLFGIQFVSLVSKHTIENNKVLSYWAPREVMKSILYDLPPQAIVFTGHTWFGFNYLQQAEGYRPDLTILSLSSFLAPDLFSRLEQPRFPNIIIPDASLENLGSATLTKNIDTHPIYWEPNISNNRLVEKYLVPERFLFRVSRNPSQIDQKMMQSYGVKISEQINQNHEIQNIEEKKFYSLIISGQGSFFLERNLPEVALDHFKVAALLFPGQASYNLLGVGHAYLKEYELAEASFLKSISENPLYHEPYQNLGEMYFSQQIFQRAEPYFEKALSLRPNHTGLLFKLGQIKQKTGKKKEALNYFKRILEVDPNHLDAQKEIAQLSTK